MFFYITCKKKRKKNQASTFDMLHTEHKAEPVVTQCWACGVCWNCSCYTHGKYCPAVLHEGNGACICKVCLLVNCHYSDMWHIVHWQSTLCLWCMLCLWHILDQRMVCAVLGVHLCLQCIQCNSVVGHAVLVYGTVVVHAVLVMCSVFVVCVCVLYLWCIMHSTVVCAVLLVCLYLWHVSSVLWILYSDLVYTNGVHAVLVLYMCHMYWWCTFCPGGVYL